VVRLSLQPVADANEMSKILLLRMSKSKGEVQSDPDLSNTKQDIANLKANYTSIGSKLKGIG
jgi:ribosomal protein L29